MSLDPSANTLLYYETQFSKKGDHPSLPHIEPYPFSKHEGRGVGEFFLLQVHIFKILVTKAQHDVHKYF